MLCSARLRSHEILSATMRLSRCYCKQGFASANVVRSASAISLLGSAVGCSSFVQERAIRCGLFLSTHPPVTRWRAMLVHGSASRSRRSRMLPSNGRNKSLHSCLSQKGGALTTSAIGQMVADLVKAAGKLVPEETSAHTLRHTFARNYLTQYPEDIVGLATLLGHSSLDTTRLYGQPSVDQLAARVEQLNINAYSG